MHYFVCKKVFEALEKTDEAKERNLFGQYSAKRMKDWQDIVKSYEHNNVYLGEAAEILISTVKYEIPSLSKRLDRWRNQVEESSRKEHEYNKSANEYRNRYEKECAAMGIPGHDVKTELRGLVSELPKLLDEVAALLQSSDTVEKAYQYYRAFVHYTASVPSGEERDTEDIDVCPTLMRVYKNGNERLQTGSPADSGAQGAAPTINWDLGAEADVVEGGEAPAIDWSAISLDEPAASGDDSTVSAPAAISWDISVEGGEAGENGEPAILNWDITTDSASDAQSADTPSDATVDVGGISWDISLEAEGEAAIEMEAAGTDESASGAPSGGVGSSGHGTETLLENTDLRNLFLTDLLELQVFLRQRRADFDVRDDFASWLHEEQQRNAPTSVQQTKEGLESFLKAVNAVIDALHARKTRQLIEIKNSNKYLERLAGQINQHLSVVNSVEGSKMAAIKQRNELQESIAQTYPRISQLTRIAKEIRKHIELALSAQYSNRKVSLIGGDLQNLK